MAKTAHLNPPHKGASRLHPENTHKKKRRHHLERPHQVPPATLARAWPAWSTYVALVPRPSHSVSGRYAEAHTTTLPDVRTYLRSSAWERTLTPGGQVARDQRLAGPKFPPGGDAGREERDAAARALARRRAGQAGRERKAEAARVLAEAQGRASASSTGLLPTVREAVALVRRREGLPDPRKGEDASKYSETPSHVLEQRAQARAHICVSVCLAFFPCLVRRVGLGSRGRGRAPRAEKE